jgi:hypothetical protein
VKDLYNESYKIQRKKLKKIPEDGKKFHVHRLVKINIVNMATYIFNVNPSKSKCNSSQK